jgi:nicotinamidase-related amidase
MNDAVTSRTQAQYDERGYGHRLGFGARPAIIVVDFQRNLTEDGFPFAWDYDEEIDATRRLLDAGRAAGVPVVLTVLAYEPGVPDGGILVEKIPGLKQFIVGTPDVEVDPRLNPGVDDYVLVKRVQSAFFGTALPTYLAKRGVDTTLICGCTTSGCVRATVVDSCSHGLRTSLVLECTGDQAPEPHMANLFDMKSKNADLVHVDEAITYLRELGHAEPAGVGAGSGREARESG